MAGLDWAGPTEEISVPGAEIPRPGHGDTISFASLWTLHWPVIGSHQSSPPLLLSYPAKPTHPPSLSSQRKELAVGWCQYCSPSIKITSRRKVLVWKFCLTCLILPAQFVWDCQQNLILCRPDGLAACWPARLDSNTGLEWSGTFLHHLTLTSPSSPPPNFPHLSARTGPPPSQAGGLGLGVLF